MNEAVFTVEQSGAPRTATVCLTLLRRADMSMRAKCFVAILMSHHSSYRLNMKALINQSLDGKDATYAALREAKRLGYVAIRRRRGGDGRFTEVVWTINWNVPPPSAQASPAGRVPRVQDPGFQTVAGTTQASVRENRSEEVPERLQQVVQSKEQQRSSLIEWEPCVTELQKHTLEINFRDLSPDLAQEVADELAGCIELGQVKECPIKYGKGIAKNARSGAFTPKAGIAVMERRKKRLAEERVREQRRAEELALRAKVAAQMADPDTQQRIRAMQKSVRDVVRESHAPVSR